MNLLQFRFLCYDRSEDSFYLMGYPLLLSPTEHSILLAVLENEQQSFEELSLLGKKPLRRGSVAVHISGINRKASLISGERLIEYRDGAYRLNYWM